MDHSCRKCRDAGELLELERARASLAEARSAAKDQLLSAVASESSAMANGLLGWTEALRRDFKSASAREHALGMMEARITSHLALLERLLDASGSERGAELSLVRLPLRGVVDSAIQSQHAAAGERAVRLAGLAVETEDVAVLGEHARISRSLGDLLIECIRSAEPGSRVGVELKSEAGVASVRLTVMQRRTAIDRTRVGVLAAAHAALFHGGSLETLVDGFVLRLPLFDAASFPAKPSVRKTLLVVRDEPELAEILAALATARGHRVVTVHDEELAARAFEVHDPDLVVVGSLDGLDRIRAVLAKASDRIRTVSSAEEASELVTKLARS